MTEDKQNAERKSFIIHMWLISLAISVLCCALFSMMTSFYVKDLNRNLAEINSRLAGIEARTLVIPQSPVATTPAPQPEPAPAVEPVSGIPEQGIELPVGAPASATPTTQPDGASVPPAAEPADAPVIETPAIAPESAPQ